MVQIIGPSLLLGVFYCLFSWEGMWQITNILGFYVGEKLGKTSATMHKYIFGQHCGGY